MSLRGLGNQLGLIGLDEGTSEIVKTQNQLLRFSQSYLIYENPSRGPGSLQSLRVEDYATLNSCELMRVAGETQRGLRLGMALRGVNQGARLHPIGAIGPLDRAQSTYPIAID